MTNWSPDGVVTSPSTLVQVIDAVIKIQHKTGGGPVVVHCRYIYTCIVCISDELSYVCVCVL